jgi:hypothetical protein
MERETASRGPPSRSREAHFETGKVSKGVRNGLQEVRPH